MATSKQWNFKKQLKKSQNTTIERRLDGYYLRRFNGVGVERVQDKQIQKSGIDLFVYTKDKKIITVEEKIRFKVYPDILLETVSNTKTRAPGWAVKPFQADWLCYYKEPKNKVIMLWGDLLRETVKKNIKQWESNYGARTARNEGYCTINVPVPEKVLYAAMDNEQGTVMCENCKTAVKFSDCMYSEHMLKTVCVNCCPNYLTGGV